MAARKGTKDFYKVLKVEKSASKADIKEAYRKLALALHPDRHDGCDMKAEEFKEVNEAYEVLKDDEKRAAFDRFGHSAFEQGGASSTSGFGGFSGVMSSVFIFSLRFTLTNSSKCLALGSVKALFPDAMSKCITNRRLIVIADPATIEIAYLAYMDYTSSVFLIICCN